MYIIKNAFVSISRNKGRNILIGIIIKRSEAEYEPDGNKTVCGKI